MKMGDLAHLIVAGTATWQRCEEAELDLVELSRTSGSPASGGVFAVRGGGQRWFVKVLQHLRHWPVLAELPEPFRTSFMESFPWRFELEMAQSGLAEIMPLGLRTVPLLHSADVGDDRIVTWWEWIEVDPAPWPIETFSHAARALGRLAARRRQGAVVNERLPAACRTSPPGHWNRLYAAERVGSVAPTLRDPAFWAAEPVAEALSANGCDWLPHAAGVLLDRLPQIVDGLDRLPLTFAHGDATPENLLRATGQDGTLALIDWGFGSLLPVGFDLAQLAIGDLQRDFRAALPLREVLHTIVPQYHAGLADEGLTVTGSQLLQGFHGALVVRGGLDGLPSSLDDSALLRDRIALMRDILIELTDLWRVP